MSIVELTSPLSFGQVLRKTRTARGFSLREFAAMVNVSPTYLSQVERNEGTKPPTAERVRRMAELLDQKPDEWIILAGRIPEDIEGLIKRQPVDLPDLIRAAADLTAEELRKLTERIRLVKRNGK